MFINFAFCIKGLLTTSFRYNWEGEMDGIKKELGKNLTHYLQHFKISL